jgi:hypothetical protein
MYDSELEIIKNLQNALEKTAQESQILADVSAFEIPAAIFEKLEKGFGEDRITWDPFLNRRGEVLYRISIKNIKPEELAALKSYLVPPKL